MTTAAALLAQAHEQNWVGLRLLENGGEGGLAKERLTFRSPATQGLGYSIEERAFGALGSAGASAYSSDQIAVDDGEDETVFNEASIAAKSHLVFTTGVAAESGNVYSITLTIYCRKFAEQRRLGVSVCEEYELDAPKPFSSIAGPFSRSRALSGCRDIHHAVWKLRR